MKSYQLQLDVLIVDSSLFSMSSDSPLKKSIPVKGTNPVTKVTGFFNARQRRELAHVS